MLMSKRRIIHALSYETILLLIIAIALSFIFEMPMEVTGSLGVAMAVTSVIWNMTFNHFFENNNSGLMLRSRLATTICRLCKICS